MINAINLLRKEIAKCDERVKEYQQIADNPEMQTSLILAEESITQVEAIKKEYIAAAKLLLKSMPKQKMKSRKNAK